MTAQDAMHFMIGVQVIVGSIVLIGIYTLARMVLGVAKFMVTPLRWAFARQREARLQALYKKWNDEPREGF